MNFMEFMIRLQTIIFIVEFYCRSLATLLKAGMAERVQEDQAVPNTRNWPATWKKQYQALQKSHPPKISFINWLELWNCWQIVIRHYWTNNWLLMAVHFRSCNLWWWLWTVTNSFLLHSSVVKFWYSFSPERPLVILWHQEAWLYWLW